MKTKAWLILATSCSLAFVAGSSLAQEQADRPPTPAKTDQPLSTSRPSSAKKKAADAAKKAAPADSETALLPAPAPATVKQNNVNVRGQADINSEVVIRLKKGDHVNILEEITLKKPKADEPDKWARIALPSQAHVWVHSSFIDSATKTVVPNKLNLRSGPGENYSILGRVPKGTVIKEVETKDHWIKIEAPAEAYAFVAAHLLAREPASTTPALATAEPPKVIPEKPSVEIVSIPPAVPPKPIETAVATPAPLPPPVLITTPVVTSPPVILPPPAPTPLPAEIILAPSRVPAIPTPEPLVAATTTLLPPTELAPAPEPAPAEETLVKRIVIREGIVKRSVSIQAPTYFVLESLAGGKTINYLYSPSTNLTLKDFRGKRIMVTGEELLDERWPNTPVINIDSVQPVP